MNDVNVLNRTQRIIVSPAAQHITVKAGTASVSGSHISVVYAGPVGPPGPQGESSIGYDYTQVSPSTTWTINHNLGYRPSVQIFSVGGLEILGEVQHVSDNQTTVSFNTAVAGTARLN